MTVNVTNQTELYAAIADNSQDINITADFTVTSLMTETTFGHVIYGNNHTITVNISTDTPKPIIKSSSTVSNLAFTGSYTISDQSSTTVEVLLIKGVGIAMHDIYVHDFTVDVSAITTANYFAGLFGTGTAGSYANIWVRNLSVLKSSKAGCDIVNASNSSNNLTVSRVSLTRDSGQTCVITPCSRANLVTWYNGYMYNIAMVRHPYFANHLYGCKSGSGSLYYNSNSGLTDGTTFTQSAYEGVEDDSPDWEDLYFTSEYGWDTSAGYPQLTAFMRSVTITAPDTAAVNTAVNLTAVDSAGETGISWVFSDGGTASGTSVSHVFASAGVYTATASIGTASATHTITVIDVAIAGSTSFANDVSHTLTASGSVSGQGSYLWSDGVSTAAHTQTYTGYTNGQTISLTCSYTYDSVTVTKSVTITCVKTTLSINADPVTVSLDGTTTITSSYDNAETPTALVIQRSDDSGSTWTDITYQSPYHCTFTDSTPTSHSFRLKFTGAVQGTIYSSTCVVNTVSQGITLNGNSYFFNGTPHTLTAVVTGMAGTGTYTWSDGITGATHTKTYTGYADDALVSVTCTYVEGGTTLSATVNLVCINGSVSLTADKSQCALTDSVTLTVAYNGHETVTQTLETSIDGGLNWTNISITSPLVITYTDTVRTLHMYRYTVVAPIQGTLTSAVSVQTTNSSVEITAPIDGAKIFVNKSVQFSSQSYDIANPTYSWSSGETTQNFTKTFTATTAAFNVTVTCTGDEGTFTDTHSIQIVPEETCAISAPSTFNNQVAISFSVPNGTYINPTNVTWYFPNSETATGQNVTKTFSGYDIGDRITVGVNADYTDSCGNTQHAVANVTLRCAPIYSYYVNPRGETFTFDSTCKILREGMRGFSEIQVATSVVSGHDFNDVNGLDYNNRQLTFNIFVKGDRPTMHAKRRELVHKLTPQKELGTFHYYRDDGSHFIIRCNIAVGFPSFQDESVKGGWVGTMSFIAPNGVWYTPTVTVSTSSPIVYSGDIPCGFSATLTGNLLNSANNEELSAISGSSLAGYEVDTEAGTIYNTSHAIGWSAVSLNSTLVRLEIGSNTITGCSSISYNAKYLGV